MQPPTPNKQKRAQTPIETGKIAQDADLLETQIAAFAANPFGGEEARQTERREHAAAMIASDPKGEIVMRGADGKLYLWKLGIPGTPASDPAQYIKCIRTDAHGNYYGSGWDRLTFADNEMTYQPVIGEPIQTNADAAAAPTATPRSDPETKPCPRCRGGASPPPKGLVCPYCHGTLRVPQGKRGNPWGRSARPLAHNINNPDRPTTLSEFYAALFYCNELALPETRFSDTEIAARARQLFPGRTDSAYDVAHYRRMYNAGRLHTHGPPLTRANKYSVRRRDGAVFIKERGKPRYVLAYRPKVGNYKNWQTAQDERTQT